MNYWDLDMNKAMLSISRSFQYKLRLMFFLAFLMVLSHPISGWEEKN